MTLILLAFLKKFWPYALAVVVVGGGALDIYSRGETHANVAEAKKVATGEARQAEVTPKIVTVYVDRIQVVHDQAQVIIKKVPVYVTKYDDSRCTINAGFVSVWNAANVGVQLSDSPNGTDEAPSGVVLSDVARQHATESEYTRTLETQLTSLQDWVTAEQKASGRPSP